MSYQNPLKDILSFRTIDTNLAKLGIVFSVAMLSLQFVVSQRLLVIIPLASGVGCLLYLGVTQRATTTWHPTLHRQIAGYLPTVVFVGLAGFVALVALAGERTIPAYLLAGGIGACIFGQIFLVRERQLDHRLILAELLLVAIVIRLAGAFATPGYIGIDIWAHNPVFVSGILDAGSLSAIADSKYVMAPIYHSYVAIGSLIFGSSKVALFLTLGLLVPLSALLIYCAGRLLLPQRWALLGTALYVFSDQFIQWGMHIIPTSLGIMLFLAVLFLLTRMLRSGVDSRVIALLIVCSLAVVFTHQLSTAVLLVLLGVTAVVALSVDLSGSGGVSSRLSGTSLTILGTTLVTLVVTVLAWSMTPHTGDRIFLWRMLDVVGVSLEEQAGVLNLASNPGTQVPVTAERTLRDAVIPYVELFGFGLLLCGAVIGGLVMIQREKTNVVNLTYLLVTTVYFVIVYGLSFFGFRVLIPGRWMVFLFAPMAIVAAGGLYFVFQRARRPVILVIILVLALGYPTTMVMAEKATLDAPAYDDQHPRFSFTESEQQAVETLEEIHPPVAAGAIHTDHPYVRLFDSPAGRYNGVTLPMAEDGGVSTYPIVYREYQSTGPVTWLIPEAGPHAIYTHSRGGSSRNLHQISATIVRLSSLTRCRVYERSG